jgi:hypothetical protein
VYSSAVDPYLRQPATVYVPDTAHLPPARDVYAISHGVQHSVGHSRLLSQSMPNEPVRQPGMYANESNISGRGRVVTMTSRDPVPTRSLHQQLPYQSQSAVVRKRPVQGTGRSLSPSNDRPQQRTRRSVSPSPNGKRHHGASLFPQDQRKRKANRHVIHIIIACSFKLPHHIYTATIYCNCLAFHQTSGSD